MMARIAQKVEHVRMQPEHVRVRYVFMCLAVSMMFIVGIWMLTLRESLANARADRQSAQALIPEGESPSLTDLLQNAAPLTVENNPSNSGQEYFSQQFSGNATGNGTALEGEGVAGSVQASPQDAQ